MAVYGYNHLRRVTSVTDPSLRLERCASLLLFQRPASICPTESWLVWVSATPSSLNNARPLKNQRIGELEALYGVWRDALADLRVLAEELTHRKVPRATALAAKVARRISELVPDDEAAPLEPEFPFQESTGVPHTPSQDYPGESDESDTDDEPSAEPQFTRVQPPPVDGKPSAFRPQLQRDVALELVPSDPAVKVFRVALAALIREMRQRRVGQQSFLLENGAAVAREAGGNSYAFAFSEEATLFEGAKVEIVIGGRVVLGHLTAIREAQGSIVVTLQEDFGARIDTCVLRIDATALLQALHDRLEKIEQGQVTAFRSDFAARVLDNSGGIHGPAAEPRWPGAEPELNQRQKEYVRVALANEISWLWGPPGTGKTQTLGVLTRLLFDAGRRILICSNTNQAVDEVLLKLCEQMERAGEAALADRKVVRLGKIDHEQLDARFGERISVDGIVARKSLGILRRKAEVEATLARLNSGVAAAEHVLRAFARADQATAAATAAEAEWRNVITETATAQAEHAQAKSSIAKLTAELSHRQQAGVVRRVFLRSEEVIRRDVFNAELRAKALGERAAQLATASGEKRERATELTRRARQAMQEVSGHDRPSLQRQVSEADARRQPLREELARIANELENLRDVVLREARIVGATITRTYLRPNEFPGFNAVIIDEASMILLPMVFYASGLATERVVVAGDFRQLPPILQSEQQAIHDILAPDIFDRAGIARATAAETPPQNLVMLTTQFRMHESFGRFISSLFYGGKLHSGSARQRSAEPPDLPEPFNQRITIVDTACVWPFVTKDAFKSRFNLMHALAVRNLVLHLHGSRPLTRETLGICAPYAAQAKLIRAILKAHQLDKQVRSRTAHGFQGGQQRVIVLDLVDSVGERNVGMFLQAETLDDVGTKLQNVALSRAQDAIVIIANLTVLDQKLPGNARLRSLIYELQRAGRVVDVRELLALRPVFDDLQQFASVPGLSGQALKDGLFDAREFARLGGRDMEGASHSIVIFSGFVTAQRVSRMSDILRHRITAGVRVRCVTRPPDSNGSIPSGDGLAALKALEAIGCVIDLRADIHEKVVLIDNAVAWFGSLNPLSHTTRTSELMSRVKDAGFVRQVAIQLALRRKPPEELDRLGATEAENPRCGTCGGWTVLRRSRFARFFACLGPCGWKQDAGRPARTNTRR